MRRFATLAALAVASIGVAVSPASAAPTIDLGTTGTGGLAIYYNQGAPETPANQAYFKVQFSPTNTNGAAFTFDSTLTSIFGDQGQFGLDLVLPAPTNNGTVLPPPLNAVANTGTPPPTTLGQVDWAINDYTTSAGPGNPANPVKNSLFFGGNGSGNGVVLTTNVLTTIPGGFQLQLAGSLITDGSIHWFNPAIPDTSLSSLGLSNFFNFSGTLTYTTAADGIVGQDFYSGSINLQAVPEPSTLISGCLGLLSLGGFGWYRRKRSA